MKTFKQFIKEQAKYQGRLGDSSPGIVGRVIQSIKDRFSPPRKIDYTNEKPIDSNSESPTNKAAKSNSIPYNKDRTQFVNDTIRGHVKTRISPTEYNSMTPYERNQQNSMNKINATVKEPGNITGLVDARTNSTYVRKEPENVPLTGRVKYNDDKSSIVPDVVKGPEPASRSSIVSTDSEQNTTTAIKR